MKLRSSMVAASILAALLLAACGSTSMGTIDGVFDGMGSRTHIGGMPSAGDLTVTGDGKTYNVTAPPDGEFSVSAPPGTYSIVGWDVGMSHEGISSCQAAVSVSDGRTSHTTVHCVFH